MFGMSKPPQAAKPIGVQRKKSAKAGASAPKPVDVGDRFAMQIELSSAQLVKLQRLGGPEWIRNQIDKISAG